MSLTRSSRRAPLSALLALGFAVAGMVAVAPAAEAAPSPVLINEFSSNNPDFIELVNTGTDPVDLTGWVLKDETDNNAFTFPAGSTIPGDGFLSLTSGQPGAFGFGLGGGDAVRLFAPADLATPVDAHTYPAHPPAGASYGRCPDGTGELRVTTGATAGQPNQCEVPSTAVKINEVESSGGTPGDWIELVNTGSGPVDVSGWRLKDDDDSRTLAIGAGTSIPAGGFLAVDVDVSGGFGLGSADSARVFLADGTTLVDEHSWAGGHAATTFGRCPDGTGAFVETASSTKGAANDCPLPAGAADIRINEVESDPEDLVELHNIGAAPVDVSGYVVKDNDDTHVFTIPAGTTIAAKGFLPLDVGASFGLGKGDSVRLYTPDQATLLDSTTYPAETHATSWGRCPDGTGEFRVVPDTLGGPNQCEVPDAAVRINELSSNNPDFIELVNTGAGPVDLSGWVLKDNSENNSYTFPAGSSIGAGEFKGLSGEGVDFAFGLGNGDSVRLFSDADPVNPIDSHTYTAHPAAGTSYGRCPDGTGAFTQTVATTKGAANSCPLPAGGDAVRINELSSNNPDFIELVNTGTDPVDLTGWVLKDNSDNNSYTFPAGASIAGGALLLLEGEEKDFVFGLGNGDSVRLFAPTDLSTPVDSFTYPGHPPAGTSYGRCPDGTGKIVLTTARTEGTANACDTGTTPDVVINEVESNGDMVADWVELKNRSDVTANVSGWKILDNDPDHVATPVVIPTGTTIAPGGYYAIYTEFNQSPGFGLGVGDSVTLLLPDGTTEVDTTTWDAHAATTWGRCPDGTGDFRETTTSTRGLANACSPIRINEIESSGGEPGDWVELVNISGDPVDVGGHVVKDDDDSHAYVIPAGTTIPARERLVVEEADLGFGLGGNDAVRLFAPDATTLVEEYSWTVAATQTYARCKDGVGEFTDAKAPTKGAPNSCPGLETEPWPGGQTVAPADLASTFVQDLSGLTFDPSDPDVLWAAQNKRGTLFKLERDAEDRFVPAEGWPKDPVYPGGTGAPDTEGIAIGPDGFVYLASERDNNASGVSRMSILRYDPAATGATITPTDEWVLNQHLPTVGANLGLEGVAFIPDAFLTARGFVDQSTGVAYDPATYPGHGSGLFAVAIEATGAIHAFALDATGGGSHLVATIESGFPNLADVVFDPERERLWALTDDTHDGKSALLRIDDAGGFVVDVAFERPVGMPNLNNEGLAIAPRSRCVDGLKEVVWSDDGDTDGHSLRRGTLSCTVPPGPVDPGPGPSPVAQEVVFTSEPPATPVVGQQWAVTTRGGASGNPVVLSVSGEACSLAGATVTFSTAGSCTVRARQAGDATYAEGQASRTLTVAKGSTTTSVGVAGSLTATVTAVAPAVGTPTGTVTFSAGGTTLGEAVLSGGVATLAGPLPADGTTVVAGYAGDDAFEGSSGSVVVDLPVVDPTITASSSPAVPASGWFRGPVTLTFSCQVGSAPLVGACPGPVTLTEEGAGQSVTRTVTAEDGGTASVTVSGIDIDTSGPRVRVRGVRDGASYVAGDVPGIECRAGDALSGLDSCETSKKARKNRRGRKVVVVAVATDVAGNVSRERVVYRIIKKSKR